MRDGKPYCLHCFDAMFAEYCDFCGEPIGVDQGQMSHDGQHWHATDQCFACSTCRCSLLGRPFLPRRGAIYCSIACSKGEPPTPSSDSGPGLRAIRQKMSKPPVKVPVPSDNESTTPPASPRCQNISREPGPSNTPEGTPTPSKSLDRVVLERNLEKLLVETSHESVTEKGFDMTDLAITVDQATQYPPQLKKDLKLQLMSASMTSSMPELGAKEPVRLPQDTCATTPEDLPTPELSELTRTDSHIILPKPTPIKKEVRFEDQGTLPRSRSYSGRARGRRNRGLKGRHRKYSAENTKNGHHHDKKSSPSTSHQQNNEDSDASSVCSTCSSSSSSGDEKMYELPQRRTYLGTRVSYVPNDALACARRRKQQQELADKDNKNCIIS